MGGLYPGGGYFGQYATGGSPPAPWAFGDIVLLTDLTISGSKLSDMAAGGAEIADLTCDPGSQLIGLDVEPV